MSAELALFDVENFVVRPTIHCYTLVVLKTIMDVYPDDYLEVYKYLYYMCSHNSKKNPFFETAEHEKEEIIMAHINCTGFSSEDDEVQAALALCRLLFTTPTSRAYMGFKKLIDNLSDFFENTDITTGRDGNLTALVGAGKSFDALRQSFKGVARDLADEQSSKSRGGTERAYDQQK